MKWLHQLNLLQPNRAGICSIPLADDSGSFASCKSSTSKLTRWYRFRTKSFRSSWKQNSFYTLIAEARTAKALALPRSPQPPKLLKADKHKWTLSPSRVLSNHLQVLSSCLSENITQISFTKICRSHMLLQPEQITYNSHSQNSHDVPGKIKFSVQMINLNLHSHKWTDLDVGRSDIVMFSPISITAKVWSFDFFLHLRQVQHREHQILLEVFRLSLRYLTTDHYSNVQYHPVIKSHNLTLSYRLKQRALNSK